MSDSTRELRRILGGEFVEDVFAVSDRSKLRNHGVLTHRRGIWFLLIRLRRFSRKIRRVLHSFRLAGVDMGHRCRV